MAAETKEIVSYATPATTFREQLAMVRNNARRKVEELEAKAKEGKKALASKLMEGKQSASIVLGGAMAGAVDGTADYFELNPEGFPEAPTLAVALLARVAGGKKAMVRDMADGGLAYVAGTVAKRGMAEMFEMWEEA